MPNEETGAAVEVPRWLADEPIVGAESVVWRTAMVTINAANQPASVRWYRNVLRFDLVYDIPIRLPTGETFRMAILLAPDNRRIQINGGAQAKSQPRSSKDVAISLLFHVRDINVAKAHLRLMNVPDFEPEIAGQVGPLLSILDPDNNIVFLQEPNQKAFADLGLQTPNDPVRPKYPRYVPD